MSGIQVLPYFHESFEMEVFHKLVDFTAKQSVHVICCQYMQFIVKWGNFRVAIT